MIRASDVFNDVKSFLDDDSSGRYTESLDLVPAINKAVLYLVAVFNSAFEAKKLSPEVLRDLSVTKILAVTGTTTKKCDLSTITDLWTILSVSPDPTVSGSPDAFSDTKHLSASRLTLEQWDNSSVDPFSPGSGISIASDFIRAAYIGPGQFMGDGKLYLMMRPGSIFAADKVALFYLKNPTKVLAGTTQIELPRNLHGLLVDKTLNYLSIQHGPESTYGKITDKEVSQLVSLMIS
jgi:hypothetical protein